MNTLVENEIHLPAFSQINPENVEAALTRILQRHRERLTHLLEQKGPFTWENLLQPLEEDDDELHLFWSPITHLNSVVNSNAWRAVYKACIPKLSEFGMEIMHNVQLFHAVQSIAESSEFAQLDQAQQKIIQHTLRDFRLAGVHLDTKAKQRFADLNKQLSQLQTTFQENFLDATQGWERLIVDAAELAGITPHAISAAKQAAEKKQLAGWLFTLEMPSYEAIMTYADSRELRKEFYTAYVTRASDQGPNAGKWDNSKIMEDILAIRREMAQLVGFEHYAAYSLANKMAKTSTEVISFLEELAGASLIKAQTEFAELRQFAKENYGMDELQAWDVLYYSEKLRQKAYAVAKEDFRPYFPEDQVLAGLFEVILRLYGVEITEIENPDVWHNAVRLFALRDDLGNSRGHLYLDLYARTGKRDGAWMGDCRIRRKLANGAIQTPIAFITCNFHAPVGNDPALFTHDEVNTLFHECGHALQHLFSTIDHAGVSGLNGIPWDAVEVASQFMESWTWEKPSVDLLARHYKTQQRLPEELFDKLIKAKNFQSAMQMVRQLQFALFDFRLHGEFDPAAKNQIQHILDEVRQKLFIYPTPEFNRFQHGFGHIFTGGYAAGYYSYKWAEVLACDAFSKFEERGIFDRATGMEFLHTLLETGGSAEPLDLFIQFRGRPPKIDALLKQNGISEQK